MTNDQIIKTVSYDQLEIIDNIITLYCPEGIDCDPTFSKGNFYKKRPKPRYCFDLNPQGDNVVKADCRNLPLTNRSVKTIMFDPPFVVAPSPKPGIIRDRFGCYKNILDLWRFYTASLKEFRRVLMAKGILIFKCQDVVSSGKNWFSHCEVYNTAKSVGFNVEDLFILCARNRIISPNMNNQKHARKYHSYFWVFKKA